MMPLGFPMREQRRRQKAPSALWLRSKLWAHRQRMVRARLTVFRVRLLRTRTSTDFVIGAQAEPRHEVFFGRPRTHVDPDLGNQTQSCRLRFDVSTNGKHLTLPINDSDDEKRPATTRVVFQRCWLEWRRSVWPAPNGTYHQFRDQS